MISARPSGVRFHSFRVYVLALFVVVCFLTGGSGRADALSLALLRPFSVICLTALLLSPGTWYWRPFLPLLGLLALFAVVIAVQLVPVPPAWWLAAPGHARYAPALAMLGSRAWMPLSVTPDLTWNSLLSLLPALTVVVGFAALRPDQRLLFLPLLIALGVVSAVLGIVQLVGGDNNRDPYLYEVTTIGLPVGLFANRNHQAVFLAMLLPSLAVWFPLGVHDPSRFQRRAFFAVGVAVLLIPVILATGSRAGMVAGAICLVLAFLLAPKPLARHRSRWRRCLPYLVWIAPLLIIAVTIFGGRAVSVERFNRLVEGNGTEQRLSELPRVLGIARDFFPFGSGFGSFDPVFRGYESDAALHPTYFNHAHNDLLELALTGGAPALFALAFFVFWWGARTAVVFCAPAIHPGLRLARLAALMVAILMLASLVDYPLRAPALTVVFAIACGWLADPGPRALKRNAMARSGPQSVAMGLARQ